MSECRLCLQIGPPVYIFDESKSLPEKIWDCCGLMTTLNDGFPDQICFPCEIKINSIIEFKQVCVKNYYILKERHNEVTGETVDSENFINIYDRSDTSPHKIDIYQEVDVKYAVDDIKVSQESETAWIDYLSKEPTNESLTTNSSMEYEEENSLIVKDEISPRQYLSDEQSNIRNERNKTVMSKKKRNNRIKPFHEKKLQSFECDLCNKTFNKKYQIYRHVKQHSYDPANQKYSRCNLCNAVCGSETSFIKHADRNHKVKWKTFECDICHNVLRNKHTLRAHIKRHMSPVKSKRKSNKRNNKKEAESDAMRYIVNKQLSETFKCDVCDKILKSRDTFREHLKLHKDQENDKYRCDKCDYKTENRGELVQHIDGIHLNKKFKCDACHKTFKRRNSVLIHLKQHMHNVYVGDDKCDSIRKNKMYRCDICEKTFKSELTIRIHLKQHLNLLKKKHHCDKCNYKTAFKYSLNRHIMTHLK